MYKKILAPLDGSKLAECVLPHVENIAKGGTTETVIFLRVAEPIPLPVSVGEGYSLNTSDWQKMEEASKAEAESYLNKVTGKLKYGKVKIQTEVMVGKAAYFWGEISLKAPLTDSAVVSALMASKTVNRSPPVTEGSMAFSALPTDR